MKTKALSAVLALIFLASGGAKLAGLEFEIAAFERWGYPMWFMVFIGVVEVIGGIGLLLPRLSALAGAALSAMMIGAMGTHVLHAEWGMLVAAAVIFTMSVARAYLGRHEIAALALRLQPSRHAH